MASINPYESPSSETAPPRRAARRSTASATRNTIIPRHIAASLDLLGSAILSLLVGRSLPDTMLALQVSAALAVYFCYYLLPEALIGRTPGKLLTGLVVVRTDGSSITWGQAIIRTLFRVLEVNPFLLGGIPAALCIVSSERRQRFGDMVADTLVVSARAARRQVRRPRGMPEM